MDDFEDWKKAGKLAARALEYGRTLIVPGARAVEVLDEIERFIISEGGQMAFPAQMSFNETAAHWCAEPDDPYVLKDEVICLDVGVHINGCIGDNALTVDLSGKHKNLLEASRKALEKAIEIIQPGITISEVGGAIKAVITEAGYLPIHNLSGHGLARFKVHEKPSVANYDNKDQTRLEKGQIIAIEPFATNGSGMIHETENANIFAFKQKRPVRSLFAREALKLIEAYNGLPFTTRWLASKMHLVKLNYALRELVQAGAINSYPPLVEIKKGIVTQAEHSIIVDKPPLVITRV